MFGACKKEENKDTSLPTLKTLSVYDIEATAATSGGNGTTSGSNVIEKGVCWSSSNPLPDISGSHTSDGTGILGFESHLAGLDGGTQYYVRAFATNKYGTGYGSVETFNTKAIPVAGISYPSYIAKTAITISGNITTAENVIIDSVGFCWSTHSRPTVQDNKYAQQYSSQVFYTTLASLSANTLYYIRTFIKSNAGIIYSNDVKVKTYYSTLTDIDGNVYNTIKIGSQEWMVENLTVGHFRNGVAVQGVSSSNLWHTVTQPAYNDYSAGSGVFAFRRYYNWYAANDGRNIAPTGWHVPNVNDWHTLNVSLGADSAGYKMRKYDIQSWYNTDCNNESSFSAQGFGYLDEDNGYSMATKSEADFWLQDVSSKVAVISSDDYFTNVDIYFSKSAGCTIRCVKD